MLEEIAGQVLGAVDQVVGLLNIDELFRLLNMPSNRKQADYGSALALGVATVAFAAVVGGIVYFYDGKAPWSRRKKHHPLTKPQWLESFDPQDGRLKDGGEKVLYKARKGGIDISIRAEVWPFLLGLYDLKSTAAERQATDSVKSAEFEDLRRQCAVLKEIIASELNKSKLEKEDSGEFEKVSEEDLLESVWEDGGGELSSSELNAKTVDDAESKKDEDTETENKVPSEPPDNPKVKVILAGGPKALEDFKDWMRIIRLDAVRMNAEWVPYSAVQANVSEEQAAGRASEVGIQDDEHLEPSRRHHAARLVAVLEAYALYDPETGYCQGMSDLLSPFVALMESDSQAFWCFVEFMKVAKANFRMDETGIRRQLRLVGQIIKCTDPQLHEQLVRIQADDCYFVYRMVVVLLRRELSFEQTVCLWEVIWADWAALRLEAVEGGSRSVRDALRKLPASKDLLLFAVSAAVLQKRKFIIEKCQGLDEILRECNAVAGKLDVWQLIDEGRHLLRIYNHKVGHEKAD